MSTVKKLWFFDDKKTFAAIQLPFQNKNFIMHIILPYGGDAIGFVKSFNMDILKMIVDQSQEVDITVRIPKFATAWTNQIDEQLQALKVKQIFQGTTLPGMIEYSEGQINVSSFTHSAGFSITEVGVSMPDITPVSTTQGPLNGQNNPPAFIMDKPSLIIIRHVGSGLIVFSSFVRQL